MKLVLALALLLVAIALLVWGAVLLARKRRGAGGSLVAVGVVMLAGLVAFSVATFLAGSSQPNVWVNGVSDSESFVVELENERIGAEGGHNVFSVGLSWDELVDVLDAQHPEGSEVGDQQWQLNSSTTPVIVRPVEDEEGQFEAIAQVAALVDENAEIVAQFPFPVTATGVGSFLPGEPEPLNGTGQAIADFYTEYEDVSFDGSSGTVPGSDGNVVVIVVDGDTVSASID